MKVVIFTVITLCFSFISSNIFSEDDEEFFDKVHNKEILEKNPIYQEILHKYMLYDQKGVGKNYFKRLIYDFVTYNLKLNSEEERLYNLALEYYLEYLPEYVEKENFSYYLNEVKFHYILDYIIKTEKIKDGL
jgi:hypothetical protein